MAPFALTSSHLHPLPPPLQTAMVAEIENMDSDIKYLGWCMWNDHNLVPLSSPNLGPI